MITKTDLRNLLNAIYKAGLSSYPQVKYREDMYPHFYRAVLDVLDTCVSFPNSKKLDPIYEMLYKMGFAVDDVAVQCGQLLARMGLAHLPKWTKGDDDRRGVGMGLGHLVP